MKLIVLSLFAVLLTSEAFAQRRSSGVGPRYNPPGSREDSRPTTRTTTTTRHNDYNDYNDYRPGYSTTYRSGPVVVGPRYNPPGSRRVIRTVRRDPYVWSSGFGYSCNIYNELTLNGRQIHRFSFGSDCHQAVSDIRNYGDFCDYNDLYDQTGYLEASFYQSYECRQALGWYY